MLEMSDVMTGFTGSLTGSHRAGRHPEGKRKRGAGKRKPCHHYPSGLFGPNSVTPATRLT
jgi:hypothetical protein